MGTPSDPKDTRCNWRCYATAATSSTLEEVVGLKMNDDRTFTLDGKFYPLKAFVMKEIYLGKLFRVVRDARREKNMGISLNPDEKNKN